MPQKTIGLPHFPHGHRSILHQQVQLIISQLSEVFPSSATTSPGQNTSDVNRLRDSLEILNGNIRGQGLQLATLERALKEVKTTYYALKDQRKVLIDKLNHTTSHDSRMPTLPVEVLEVICAISLNKHGLSYGEDAWGNIFHSSTLRLHFCGIEQLVSDPTRKAIKRGARLHVTGLGSYHSEELKRFLGTSVPTPSSCGVWKAVNFAIPMLPIEHPQFAAVLSRCQPLFSTVERAHFSLGNDSMKERIPHQLLVSPLIHGTF